MHKDERLDISLGYNPLGNYASRVLCESCRPPFDPLKNTSPLLSCNYGENKIPK